MIKSGDTFHIRRLDGLDPMIGWAMGAETGHMTIAVERNGIMHVCESNAKGQYWPINGIQCSPYDDWIEMANTASHHYVWAPIDPEITFDVEKANQYIDKILGVDYGFEVILMGWIDMVDTLPCFNKNPKRLPEDGGLCLNIEFFEVLFTFVERHFK